MSQNDEMIYILKIDSPSELFVLNNPISEERLSRLQRWLLREDWKRRNNKRDPIDYKKEITEWLTDRGYKLIPHKGYYGIYTHKQFPGVPDDKLEDYINEDD